MSTFFQLLSSPWHWSVSGAAIAAIMFLLLYFGKTFGISSTLRTMCTVAGAGKKYEFFRFDWRKERWNLVFTFGAVIGGFIATQLLASPEAVDISAEARAHLLSIGVDHDRSDAGFVPPELFSLTGDHPLRNLVLLIAGGFLVGFGTRYAGGCTSGHAISGLANLQIPSLIAVVGFFAGGLLMSWLVLPWLLGM